MRDFITRRDFNGVSEFQKELAEQLSIVFDQRFIKTEWSASIDRNIYSPRLV